jgi:putative membrane protein
MRNVFVILPVLALALLSGCKGDQEEAQTTRSTAARAQPTDSGPRAIYPEGEALKVLLTIDSARMVSARVARDRSQNENVLEFARVMLVDHRAISQLLDSLIVATGQTAADNALTQELRSANEQFVTDLMARDTGFNNAYIAQEVSDHERALILLDTALIQSARNPQVKAILEQLRPAFEAHLQRAQQIQAARRAAAAAAPRPAPSPVLGTPIRIDTAVVTSTTNNL